MLLPLSWETDLVSSPPASDIQFTFWQLEGRRQGKAANVNEAPNKNLKQR